MSVNLIMLGPPGAGKGTQAERFAREESIPKISTGDILRDAVTAGSELGGVAKRAMDAGQLVSDDVMIGIVRERLARPDVARVARLVFLTAYHCANDTIRYHYKPTTLPMF